MWIRDRRVVHVEKGARWRKKESTYEGKSVLVVRVRVSEGVCWWW
jgi:hypothetical protein